MCIASCNKKNFENFSMLDFSSFSLVQTMRVFAEMITKIKLVLE